MKISVLFLYFNLKKNSFQSNYLIKNKKNRKYLLGFSTKKIL